MKKNTKKLKKLLTKAKKANKSYREGNPFIDDQEYDLLTEKIKEIDPRNEFINSVEAETKGNRKEIKHEEKMLSIDKVYSIPELYSKFFNKINKEYGVQTCIASPKLDGCAAKTLKGMGLTTRGDGETGYLIPKNIVDFIIHKEEREILDYGTNGEIVVTNKDFERFLSKDYSHPRNFVSGLVNTDNLTELQLKVLKRGIVQFIPHENQNNQIQIDTDINEEALFEIIENIKSKNTFPIDGIVFTLQNKDIRKKMGATNHHPRWQIALKDKAETKVTKVLDIEYQIGRTGLATPVLKVEPIVLSGANISSVTAHNVQMLIDEEIGIGTEVEIIRSGEVIPTIVDVIKTAIPIIPEFCPSCNEKLEQEGLFLKCNNKKCQERLVQSAFHWFRCLDNSDFFGIETIRKLSKNDIQTIDEIYECTEDDFLYFGFGPKQSKNLEYSLKLSQSKEVWDWKILAAFGVPGVERGLAKRLLEKHKINKLTSLTRKDILQIDGFGKVVSGNFIEWMKENSELFDRMILNFNIVHTNDQKVEAMESIYSRMNILFTGSIEGYTRESIKEFAKSYGINPVSSVSKKTDIVVIGDNPGESKVNKAKELGIKIISFNEFYENIKEEN